VKNGNFQRITKSNRSRPSVLSVPSAPQLASVAMVQGNVQQEKAPICQEEEDREVRLPAQPSELVGNGRTGRSCWNEPHRRARALLSHERAVTLSLPTYRTCTVLLARYRESSKYRESSNQCMLRFTSFDKVLPLRPNRWRASFPLVLAMHGCMRVYHSGALNWLCRLQACAFFEHGSQKSTWPRLFMQPLKEMRHEQFRNKQTVDGMTWTWRYCRSLSATFPTIQYL